MITKYTYRRKLAKELHKCDGDCNRMNNSRLCKNKKNTIHCTNLNCSDKFVVVFSHCLPD